MMGTPDKKIKVRVKLFSYFCSFAGKTENRYFFDMEIPERITAATLCSLLKIPGHLPRVMHINGRVREKEYLLEEGDEVSILPLMEGG